MQSGALQQQVACLLEHAHSLVLLKVVVVGMAGCDAVEVAA
jgi:hypothetical protein